MAVTMATPPTVLQNTLPAATHNLEFEHCSTAQCTVLDLTENLIIKIDDLVRLWTKLLLALTLAVHLVQNYMSAMMMKTFCTGVCQKIKSDSLQKDLLY